MTQTGAKIGDPSAVLHCMSPAHPHASLQQALHSSLDAPKIRPYTRALPLLKPYTEENTSIHYGELTNLTDMPAIHRPVSQYRQRRHILHGLGHTVVTAMYCSSLKMLVQELIPPDPDREATPPSAPATITAPVPGTTAGVEKIGLGDL